MERISILPFFTQEICVDRLIN